MVPAVGSPQFRALEGILRGRCVCTPSCGNVSVYLLRAAVPSTCSGMQGSTSLIPARPGRLSPTSITTRTRRAGISAILVFAVLMTQLRLLGLLPIPERTSGGVGFKAWNGSGPLVRAGVSANLALPSPKLGSNSHRHSCGTAGRCRHYRYIISRDAGRWPRPTSAMASIPMGKRIG
jgi:hypothetical protein